MIAIVLLILLSLFFVYRTHLAHLRKEKTKKASVELESVEEIKVDSVINKCNASIVTTVSTVNEVYTELLSGLKSENLKTLKKAQKRIDQLNLDTKSMKNNMLLTLKKLEKNSIETGHYYVQVLDYLREIAHCVNFISNPVYQHVANNHKGLLEEQTNELKEIGKKTNQFFAESLKIIKDRKYSHLDLVFEMQQGILSELEKSRKAQVKRLKSEQVGTKNTLLFLNILQETKNLTLFSVNMLKSHRDFLQAHENAKF
jgi:Na+/phosphate symporter